MSRKRSFRSEPPRSPDGNQWCSNWRTRGKQKRCRGRRPRRYTGGFFSASWTAAIAPWNPIFECVPSQKGLVLDPPQRQSAALMTGTALPCASIRLNSPCTTYGPLSLILMVMLIGRSEYRILCPILDVPLIGIPGELDRHGVFHDDGDLVR